MNKLLALLISCILLLGIAGCSWNLSLFNDDLETEDKIEIGLHNSLKSTAVAYNELTEYLEEHEHLFDTEQKEQIEDYARIYRYSYHSALDAWIAYKAHGDEEHLDLFIEEAMNAIKSFTELKELIQGETNE